MTGRVLMLLGPGILALGACSPEPAGRPGPAVEAPPVADTFALSTGEALAAELETLGYEIADLDRLVEAVPAPASDEPRALLVEARSARDGARAAIAAGDTAAAVAAIETAATRIEAVKRALGVAEEWGAEVPPEGQP